MQEERFTEVKRLVTKAMAVRDVFITIDPGLRSMGVAIWDYRTIEDTVPPITTLLCKMNSLELALPYNDRAVIQGNRINNLLKDLPHVQGVYCEQPIFFGGSVGPKTIDDAMKLMFFVGHLNAIVRKWDVDFEPIPVNVWKGQLPKHLVNRRIVRILGSSACSGFSEDIWDSVGIGLHIKMREGAKITW